MPESEQVHYHLPAVVAVALQTNRPEVLRALKDEAADKLKELPEGEKAIMVGELFKLIADMMEDKQRLKRKVDAFEEVRDTFDRAKDDIDSAMDELDEALEEIRREEREKKT